MMKLVFATHNAHKYSEVQSLLNTGITLLRLDDINCMEEIAEPFLTLEENAAEKARYIYSTYKVNCFADDTGLEIDALGNEPGVFSARYAGDDKDPEANMNKVLEKLLGIQNRKARFRTVIALIIDGQQTLFEGIVEGVILYARQGDKGFGYDPIFQPLGHELSFAQMSLDDKNTISHRAIAFNKLISYLNKNVR